MSSTITTDRPVLSQEMSIDEAMQLLASGKVTVEEYLAWDKVRVALIAAKAKASVPQQQRGLSCKVSEKGCLSVYGLNRQWPVSLYVEQWDRLIEFIPKLQEFAKANAGKLSRKSA